MPWVHEVIIKNPISHRRGSCYLGLVPQGLLHSSDNLWVERPWAQVQLIKSLLLPTSSQAQSWLTALHIWCPLGCPVVLLLCYFIILSLYLIESVASCQSPIETLCLSKPTDALHLCHVKIFWYVILNLNVFNDNQCFFLLIKLDYFLEFVINKNYCCFTTVKYAF